MNEYIQANKRSLYMLTGLLFLLAIVLFFLVLRPLMQDVDAQKQTNNAKKVVNKILETQIKNKKEQHEAEDPDQHVLEEKVPLERKVDEYILSLEQLENKTESEISNIEFVYDSTIEIPEAETEETDEDGEETSEEAAEDLTDGFADQLQMLTVRFTATSPSYADFIDLLESIEAEERISIVTNLDFNQPTEYTQTEDDETVSFDIDLSTFYFNQ